MERGRRLALVALVAVPGTLLAIEPSSARACGSTPCALRTEVVPRDGARGVPTNTEVRVLYFGTLRGYTPEGPDCDVPLARMRLVTDSIAPIELEASVEEAGETEVWMVGRPSSPLMPGRRYALQLRESADGNDCACDESRSWVDVAAFTTGDTSDGEVPLLFGSVRFSAEARVDEGSTCGHTDGLYTDVAFTPADDASPDIRYDIIVDGQIATRYVADLASEIFVDCGSTALMTSTVIASTAQLAVRAVDLAGNTSQAIAAELIGLNCEVSEPGAREEDAAVVAEAGAPSPRSASLEDGARVEPGGASSTCATSPGRGSAAAAPVLLALALCARRRRHLAPD